MAEKDAVKPEINPEPTREERDALAEALARLLEPPAEPRTAWWRRAVEENLGEDEPER
jgi:hypothetical protein